MKYYVTDESTSVKGTNNIILPTKYENCKLAKVYVDKKTGETKFPYDGQLGVLSRSDGSAVLNQSKFVIRHVYYYYSVYTSIGGTITVAAVYGPLEAKPQRLSIEKSVVECHYRPKSGLPGVAERVKESMIRNTCETALLATLFPRTSISVVIQEVQNCGQVIACAVNSACLALLNSGTDMKFVVGAATCMIDETTNEIIVNPTHLLLKKAQTVFTFVFENMNLNIVTSHTAGTFTESQYKEAVMKCREFTAPIFDYYKLLLLQQFNKNKVN